MSRETLWLYAVRHQPRACISGRRAKRMTDYEVFPTLRCRCIFGGSVNSSPEIRGAGVL
ncbi:MAG: hypothetical protein P4L42_00805 [Desulfocapsaceae bacterium]|nr:hypothetical protein [Desulfocapsaceae bacterium]